MRVTFGLHRRSWWPFSLRLIDDLIIPGSVQCGFVKANNILLASHSPQYWDDCKSVSAWWVDDIRTGDIFVSMFPVLSNPVGGGLLCFCTWLSQGHEQCLEDKLTRLFTFLIGCFNISIVFRKKNHIRPKFCDGHIWLRLIGKQESKGVSGQYRMHLGQNKDWHQEVYSHSKHNARPRRTHTYTRRWRALENMPGLSSGNNNITHPLPSCS